jgi:hypothetical protein
MPGPADCAALLARTPGGVRAFLVMATGDRLRVNSAERDDCVKTSQARNVAAVRLEFFDSFFKKSDRPL